MNPNFKVNMVSIHTLSMCTDAQMGAMRYEPDLCLLECSNSDSNVLYSTHTHNKYTLFCQHVHLFEADKKKIRKV